jgi:hypothetical protein
LPRSDIAISKTGSDDAEARFSMGLRILARLIARRLLTQGTATSAERAGDSGRVDVEEGD